ncbi:MAG TPA: MFS transporter [Rhodopila sp.]|uniref:MFS transporter n=1 Tax=Rhodopila sp. TaxID=2480087 RepID=UPI002C934218|nr:MFS transporter [Rhodopila sp.]HVY14291.1 MFS transporter [Rhodopila sp.]
MGYKRWLVIVLLLLANTVNFIDRVNISVAGREIAATFGLGPEALGVIFSCFFYSYIPLILPMGLLCDRFGARAIMGSGMVIWAIGSAVTGLATGFGTLVGARLLLGVGESSSYPASQRILREWAPRGERALMITTFHAGSSFGPALGIALTSFLISMFDWRISFIIVGVGTAVLAAIWFTLYRAPETAPWLDETERNYIVQQREPPRQDAVHAMSLRALLRQPVMWGLMVTQGCQTFSLYLFLTWLPSYLRTVRHLDLFSAGWLASLPYVVTAFGLVLSGLVSDRLVRNVDLSTGARRYLMILMMAVACCVLFVPYAESLTVMEVLIILSILCANVSNGLNFAVAADLIHDRESAGAVFGLVVLGGNSVGFMAPILTGFIIAYTQHYTLSFVLAATLLAIGMATSWLVVRRPLQPVTATIAATA